VIPQDWPRDLRALVHAAFGPEGSPLSRLLMLDTWEAYCDESKDEQGTLALSVAAIVAPAGVWAVLWRQWTDALLNEQIKEFHAVDVEQGHGECEGWPIGRRCDLQARFIALITNAAAYLTGYVSTVMLQPYTARIAELKRLRRIPSGLAVSGTLDDPYFMLFQHVVETVHQSMADSEVPEAERVAFIFDHHHLKERAKAIHAAMNADADYAHRHRTPGPIQFNDSVTVKPLQVADILAYEAHRYFLDQVFGDKDERWQFTELRKVLPARHAQFFNEHAIDQFVDRLERRGGPWYS
jgi:hypothetical protein